MIERNFKKFLQKIATEDLNDNLLAQVVAVYYEKVRNISDKKTFYEVIEDYYKLHDKFQNLPDFEINESPDNVDISNRDFRIEKIRISNVRAFPKGKKYKGSEVPYGIDFKSENEKCCNYFMLAPNGMGKSSIYSAIEYIFTGEVSEFKIRSKNINESTEHEEFLTHFSEGFDDSFIEVTTRSGVYSIKDKIFTNNNVGITNPETHFISEYDLAENAKLNFEGRIINKKQEDDYLHFMFAQSLGLKEYLEFKILLQNLMGYGRSTETKLINEITKSIAQKNDSLNRLGLRLSENKNRIFEFDELSKTEVLDKNRESVEKRKILIKERQEIEFDINLVTEKLINSMEEFLTEHTKLISMVTDEFDADEVQFLTIGLNLSEKKNQCPYCLDSKKTQEMIKKEVTGRIIGAKEYKLMSDKVAQIFNYINTSISYIYGLDYKISRIINDDKDSLSEFSELEDLLKLENEIIIDKETLYNSNIYEHAKEFWDKSGYDPNELEKFSYFIADYKTYYIDYLTHIINPVKKIEELRRTKLNELLANIANDEINKYSNEIVYIEIENDKISAEMQTIKKDINDLERNLQKAIEDQNLFERVKKDSKPYFEVISNKINNIVNENLNPISDVIVSIMNEYLVDLDDNIDLKLVIDKNSEDLIFAQLNVTNKITGNASTISPKKYFNSFRYKLFCTMISCSIAIASRKNTGNNLPLIFDDIFSSSDYRNRKSVKLFLKKLIILFVKSATMPTQFIVFTHDDLIFNVAIDAIDELETEEFKGIKSRTIFSKLYSHKDLDDYPKGESDNLFWDLSLRIPNSIELEERVYEK